MLHKTSFALGSLTSPAPGTKIQISSGMDARANNFLNLASTRESRELQAVGGTSESLLELRKIAQRTNKRSANSRQVVDVEQDELLPALEHQAHQAHQGHYSGSALDLIRVKSEQLADEKADEVDEADEDSSNLYSVFAKKKKSKADKVGKVKKEKTKGKKKVDDAEAKVEAKSIEEFGEESQFAAAIAARIEAVAARDKEEKAKAGDSEEKEEQEKQTWLTVIADITHDSFVAADLPNVHRDFRRRIATYDSGYRDGKLQEGVNGLTSLNNLSRSACVKTSNTSDFNNTRLVSCWCCRAVEGLMSPWSPRNPLAKCSTPFILQPSSSPSPRIEDEKKTELVADKVVEFKWCSRCGVVAYCSTSCQLADEKIHKSICSPTLAKRTATAKRSRATFLRKETSRGTSIFFSSLTPLPRQVVSSINPLSKEAKANDILAREVLARAARPTIKTMPPKAGAHNDVKNAPVNKRRKVDDVNYNLTNNYNSIKSDELNSTYRWLGRPCSTTGAVSYPNLYHWKTAKATCTLSKISAKQKLAAALKEVIVLE